MEKVHGIVDSLLNKHQGGEVFFNKFDEVIRMPENLDIVKELFKRIYQDNGNKFNIIVSGKFGDWIKYLVNKGELKPPGNLLCVNGSLRGKGTYQGGVKFGKEVEVIYYKNDFHNQDFIFLDDSYYSGSTKKAIEEYLKKFGSKIVKTYVIYDGNEQKDLTRNSLYRYYDYKKSKIIPVQKLYDIVDKIQDKIPFDKSILINKISTGEIRTTQDLYKLIQRVSNKFGYDFDKEKVYNLTYRHTENKTYIVKFKDFLK